MKLALLSAAMAAILSEFGVHADYGNGGLSHDDFATSDYSCFCGQGGSWNGDDVIPTDSSQGPAVHGHVAAPEGGRNCAQSATKYYLERLVAPDPSEEDVSSLWTAHAAETCAVRLESFDGSSVCKAHDSTYDDQCSGYTTQGDCNVVPMFAVEEDVTHYCNFHDMATEDWLTESSCSCDGQCSEEWDPASSTMMSVCTAHSASGAAACEAQEFVKLSGCGWDKAWDKGINSILHGNSWDPQPSTTCCTVDYAEKFAPICAAAFGGTTFDPTAIFEGTTCEDAVSSYESADDLFRQGSWNVNRIQTPCCTGGDGPSLDCFCEAGQTFDISGDEKNVPDWGIGSCLSMATPYFDGVSCTSSLSALADGTFVSQEDGSMNGNSYTPENNIRFLTSIGSACCEGAPTTSLADDYYMCLCPSGMLNGNTDEIEIHGNEGTCASFAAKEAKEMTFLFGEDPLKAPSTCEDDTAQHSPKCVGRNFQAYDSCTAAASSESECESATYTVTLECSHEGNTQCRLDDYDGEMVCRGHQWQANNAPGFTACPDTQDESVCTAARWSSSSEICRGESADTDGDYDDSQGQPPMDGGACAAASTNDCRATTYEVALECKWKDPAQEIDSDWVDECCAVDPLAGIDMCDGVDGADLDGYDGLRRLPFHGLTCASMWGTIQNHLEGDMALLTTHTSTEFGDGAPYTTSGDNVLSICCGLACQDYDDGLAWNVATIGDDADGPVDEIESCAAAAAFSLPDDWATAFSLTNPIDLCTIAQDAAGSPGMQDDEAANFIAELEKNVNVFCPITCSESGNAVLNYCSIPTAVPTANPTASPTVEATAQDDGGDSNVVEYVVEDVVMDIVMELTFAEELTAADETEACDELVAAMLPTNWGSLFECDVPVTSCDMSLQSRRARHLLSFVYDTEITITILAVVLDNSDLVSLWLEDLQATIADTAALEDAVVDAVADIGGGAVVGEVETKIAGVAPPPNDDDGSGTVGPSIALALCASAAAYLVQ